MSAKRLPISAMFSEGIYKGRVNSRNLPHGRGKMKYRDGSVFDGFFCEGRKHGNGNLLLPSGNKYKGQFFNGRREGYGEFTYARTQEVYAGFWRNNVREGRGEYRFQDGSIFRGVFQNDLRHGVGRYRSTRMVYTGEWREGKKHGVFKFTHLGTGKVSLAKFVDGHKVKTRSPRRRSARTTGSKLRAKLRGCENANCPNLAMDLKSETKKNKGCQAAEPQLAGFSEKAPLPKKQRGKAFSPRVQQSNLQKRAFDFFEKTQEDGFKGGKLSAIREVPECIALTATDEGGPRIPLFPEKESVYLSQSDPQLQLGNASRLQSAPLGTNLYGHPDKHLQSPTYALQSDLLPRSKGAVQSHFEASEWKKPDKCSGSHLNQSTSLDLEVKNREKSIG